MHPEIYITTPSGRSVGLLRPTVEEVDFQDIALALAGINRYSGNVASVTAPVSVALHTLLVIDAAPDFAKPYCALHDAPESRLGDLTRPWKRAAHAKVAEIYGEQIADEIDLATYALHHAHFLVICRAADLPPPDEAVLEAIDKADAVALATETQWWRAEPRGDGRTRRAMAATPARRRPKWLPADKAADALMERFRQLLPVFRKHAA